MVDKSFTCECGHEERYHDYEHRQYIASCRLCQDRQYKMVVTGSGMTVYYPWHEFKADNLRYLELKYEQKRMGLE